MSETEYKYRMLIEKLPEAFAYHRVVLDDAGKPANCVILGANASFKKMTGLNREKIVGRMITDVMPGIKQTDFDWISVFGQVAMTGKNECIEIYNKQDKRWFEIIAYSDNPGYVAAIFREITERKIADEKINYISFHDRLTGLFNRDYLEEEMRRLDTERQLPISIIYADVNGLKLINDIFGHSTGDEMLLRAAEILTKSCREEDIIARWGGDEFVIMLPQTEKREVMTICKRINDQCSTARVRDIPFSIALGSAVKLDAEKNILEVLEAADANLYKNKSFQNLNLKKVFFKSLFDILKEKCYETNEHILCMRKVALKIGKRLSLPETELKRLAKLIILHDIGNINIPAAILLKKDPFTAKEWQIIKRHPETGYRIARATEELASVAEDILGHHERWDGLGYPRGLKEEEIPLLARVAAIADAYEVMTRGRPYKRPMSAGAAVAELDKHAGYHFDPQLVNIFTAIADKSADNSAYN